MCVSSESPKGGGRRLLKAVYCLLVLLAGCTSVPKPSPYTYSSQQQMQAAHHWQVLASEVAEQVATRFQGGSLASAGYVSVPSDTSSFGMAFPNLLVTELGKRNIPASLEKDNPNSPLRLKWDVQRVVHQANRSHPSLPLGWLTGSVAVLVASPFVDVSPVLGSGPLSHSEIIITTQLIDRNSREELLRDNDLYYINDQDSGHYPLGPSLPPKSYTVVNR
jgi:hypothetical protein